MLPDITSAEVSGGTVVHAVCSQPRNVGVLKCITRCLRPEHLDIEDQNGKTALWHVVRLNRADDTTVLLLRGATAQKLHPYQDRAAAFAVGRGGATLMSKSASLMALVSQSGHPGSNQFVRAAAEAGNQRALELLCLKHSGNVNGQRRRDGETPLIAAARWGFTGCVTTLLDFGADHALRDIDGKSAAHHAAEEGHAGVLSELRAAGADFELSDRSGWMPLHLAAAGGFTDCIAELYVAGIDLNRPLPTGEQATHLAARAGACLLLRLLHEMGCDLTDRKVLHAAAENGSVDCATFIISCGAKWQQHTVSGRSAAEISREHGHELCAVALRPPLLPQLLRHEVVPVPAIRLPSCLLCNDATTTFTTQLTEDVDALRAQNTWEAPSMNSSKHSKSVKSYKSGKSVKTSSAHLTQPGTTGNMLTANDDPVRHISMDMGIRKEVSWLARDDSCYSTGDPDNLHLPSVPDVDVINLSLPAPTPRTPSPSQQTPSSDTGMVISPRYFPKRVSTKHHGGPI